MQGSKVHEDLADWEERLAREDSRLRSTQNTSHKQHILPSAIPPPRSHGAIATHTAPTQPAAPQPPGAPARLPGHDFRAWDKWAANADNEEEDSAPAPPAAPAAPPPPAHSAARVPKLNVSAMDADTRERLALREKEKGNECMRSKDYDEAAVYYSRSLE